MKNRSKVILAFFIVYLVCAIADSTPWIPFFKPYAEASGHICVLIFVVYLFVTAESNKPI